MYEGQFLFAQIMDFLPRDVFDACVDRYRGDFNNKGLICRDQFLAIGYGLLTDLDGLRSIQNTLDVHRQFLYHMGFRGGVPSKSALSYASKRRSWRIYAELAIALMKRARILYANDPLAIDLDAEVFALDSTTIDLCLARFPWTPSQQKMAAVKMHVLLDLHGNIPDFIVVSGGKTHDVNMLDLLHYIAGAYYIMDRAYVDFARLYRLHQSKAFFVTRAKRPMRFSVVESRPVDKAEGLLCDQTIRLTVPGSKENYPEYMRRIKYRDPDTGRTLVFLTNNFILPALMIAALYKQRWQVELFSNGLNSTSGSRSFTGIQKTLFAPKFGSPWRFTACWRSSRRN